MERKGGKKQRKKGRGKGEDRGAKRREGKEGMLEDGTIRREDGRGEKS